MQCGAATSTLPHPASKHCITQATTPVCDWQRLRVWGWHNNVPVGVAVSECMATLLLPLRTLTPPSLSCLCSEYPLTCYVCRVLTTCTAAMAAPLPFSPLLTGLPRPAGMGGWALWLQLTLLSTRQDRPHDQQVPERGAGKPCGRPKGGGQGGGVQDGS